MVDIRCVKFDETLLLKPRPLPDVSRRIVSHIDKNLRIHIDPEEAKKAERVATATLAKLESQHEALVRARKLNQEVIESLTKARIILLEMEEKETVCGYIWFQVKAFAKGRCLQRGSESDLEGDIKRVGGILESPSAGPKLRDRYKPESVGPSKKRGSSPIMPTEFGDSRPEVLRITQDQDDALALHLENLRIAALAMGKELDTQDKTLGKIGDEMRTDLLDENITIAGRLINTFAPPMRPPVPH